MRADAPAFAPGASAGAAASAQLRHGFKETTSHPSSLDMALIDDSHSTAAGAATNAGGVPVSPLATPIPAGLAQQHLLQVSDVYRDLWGAAAMAYPQPTIGGLGHFGTPRSGLQLLATAAPTVSPHGPPPTPPSLGAGIIQQAFSPAGLATAPTPPPSAAAPTSAAPDAAAFASAPSPPPPPATPAPMAAALGTPERKPSNIPDALKVLWTPSTMVPGDSPAPFEAPTVRGLNWRPKVFAADDFETARFRLLQLRPSLAECRPPPDFHYTARAAGELQPPPRAFLSKAANRQAKQAAAVPKAVATGAAPPKARGQPTMPAQSVQSVQSGPAAPAPTLGALPKKSTPMPVKVEAPLLDDGHAAGALLLGILQGKSIEDVSGKENEGAMLLKLLQSGVQKEAEARNDEWGDEKKWQTRENSSAEKQWDSNAKGWMNWDSGKAWSHQGGEISTSGAWPKPSDTTSARRSDDKSWAAAVAAAPASTQQQSRAAIRQAAAAARRSAGAPEGTGRLTVRST